jgi:hypothetical protein
MTAVVSALDQTIGGWTCLPVESVAPAKSWPRSQVVNLMVAGCTSNDTAGAGTAAGLLLQPTATRTDATTARTPRTIMAPPPEILSLWAPSAKFG